MDSTNLLLADFKVHTQILEMFGSEITGSEKKGAEHNRKQGSSSLSMAGIVSRFPCKFKALHASYMKEDNTPSTSMRWPILGQC
jgi:hypothetical protein